MTAARGILVASVVSLLLAAGAEAKGKPTWGQSGPSSSSSATGVTQPSAGHATATADHLITFSEFAGGTAITNQYEPQGILFGGDDPFIAGDGANPTSPVLSGTPLFHGSIEGTFVTPGTTDPAVVGAFTLDVGWIDDPGSVEVTFYNSTGVELGSTPASSVGINTLTITHSGIHSFLVHASGFEDFGFAIDNVSFNDPQPAAAAKYVALGDSYSSGEGVEPFFDSDACHRSQLAYSVFVQPPGFGDTIYHEAQAGTPGVGWGFNACSGAKTNHVLKKQLGKKPDKHNPNSSLVDAKTTLVTITVGGNDLQWTDVLNFCAFNADCTTTKYKGKSLDQYLRDRRDAVAPNLTDVYDRIHSLAPDATVLVLGYPQIFPASPAEQNCAKLAQHTLFHHSIGFSQTEQNYLRQATSEANQTIADRAELSGATFVPVDSIFAGHEVCGNGGEWINAVTLSLSGQNHHINDQSFHPNEDGQRLGYAAAINQELGGP